MTETPEPGVVDATFPPVEIAPDLAREIVVLLATGTVVVLVPDRATSADLRTTAIAVGLRSTAGAVGLIKQAAG